MRKISLLFFLFLAISVAGYGQSTSVRGQAVGGGSPLIGATVALLNAQDSSVYKGAATDVEGRFEIAGIQNGRFVLKISYLGFGTLYRSVTATGAPIQLGTLTLSAGATTLREVEVVGRAATVIQKQDTSEMNAAAFKVNRDANAENLIQKMPGITIQNGQVQAQGERVQRILVDGKEFFGEDPNAVLKNLPAEVISKIQVFDRQSDQAQFTGFNDGNEQKTINIVTKPEFRTGRFGRISAGAGTDGRYRISGNINQFEGDRRISIVGLSNNVNEQNFSSEDLVGVASASSRGGGGNRGGGGGGGPRGGGGGGFGGGNNTGDFLVNTNNGIAKTNAIGINYLDKWGKKVDVQGSYFFNHTDNDYTYSSFRNFERDGYQVRENGNSDGINQNHRFNLRLTYNIDSANSIIVRPRLSVQQNNGDSFTESNLLGNLDGQSRNIFINNFDNLFRSDLKGINFNNNILYRHSFAKRGRTISLDVSNGYNQNKGDNRSDISYFFDRNNEGDDSLVYLNSNLNNRGYSVGGSLNYTEPLTQNTQLQLTYATNYSNSDGDRRTYQFRPVSELYDSLVANQSSTVDNVTRTQEFGGGWRYNTRNFQLMLSARYQWLELSTDQLYPTAIDTTRNYHNVLPFAMLRYNFNQDRNIRIFYMGRSQTPSVDQLQSAVDVSNPTLITQGNPNLGQSFSHNFNIRYSAANPGKSSNFFAVLGGSVSQDYIGRLTIRNNARGENAPSYTTPSGIVLRSGVQLSSPVNLSGQYSLRSFFNYGLPLGFIKSNLNLNANATYSFTPALYADTESDYRIVNNDTKSTNLGGGVVLSSNISENFDFLVSTNATYNKVDYTYLTQQGNNNYNQSSFVRLNWLAWKGLNITTEVNHQYNGGLSAGIDKTFMLWNGSIGYKFMKDKQAEIRLSGFDLLGENTSIQRNYQANYIEDVQTTVLQRYFMLSFNYNLRQFGSSRGGNTPPATPGGYPGGGYPGGGRPGGNF
ncbi:outer membrane beta-barrel protein [Rufibacter sediminis]|uniref:TonB-dependent receptor n=1 Tax=Rufibacter sediminis TaxID=2762756 RepID=A0ABR6VUF0_9BACT|nr:outer membrane beta-barrel protein [Rufibacter sediminis]MBC3540246.1 TonB-dependent receptor [Rufibacter sediminis]